MTIFRFEDILLLITSLTLFMYMAQCDLFTSKTNVAILFL